MALAVAVSMAVFAVAGNYNFARYSWQSRVIVAASSLSGVGFLTAFFGQIVAYSSRPILESDRSKLRFKNAVASREQTEKDLDRQGLLINGKRVTKKAFKAALEGSNSELYAIANQRYMLEAYESINQRFMDKYPDQKVKRYVGGGGGYFVNYLPQQQKLEFIALYDLIEVTEESQRLLLEKIEVHMVAGARDREADLRYTLRHRAILGQKEHLSALSGSGSIGYFL
ncbi:MAG: hypothetical protein S4CHLAM81_04260 [Chlamydiales bacterium]|nr:hypothetical protein [Chlamydiales bacterium]MCH9635215.1 hypothetical protein [Chlamydiales bacterium]